MAHPLAIYRMALDAICMPIQNELEGVEETLEKHTYTDIPLIRDVVRHVLKNGGKRLRPILTILSARLAGYTKEDVIRYAAVFELLHTASLMHDDVLDNASLRRHHTTANIKWGNQLSILIGDYLWSKGSELIASYADKRILEVVTSAISKMSEGEILEVVRSNDFSITEDDYIEIIRKKTAALISACCEVGAILGHLSEPFESALKNYGSLVGMAFQLADDVLDYSASEAKLGKTTGTDLREGKLTLPLIHTLSRCSEGEAALIKEAVIAKSFERQKFIEVVGLLNKYGGIEMTKKRATLLIAKAKEELSIFKSSIERDALYSLADYTYKRDE